MSERIAYEEVPGSRTTQQAIDQPQRERIAHEELRPGDVIQEGDEWQNECGRWQPFASLSGSQLQVRHSQRARRPYRVSTIKEIGDALANAQKAATQLQDERDELKAALRESHAAHKVTMEQGLAAIAERNKAERLLAEAQMQRDKAWSDQKAIQSYRDTALQELTEARAERDRLQGLIDDLLDEPTAKQVQEMLRTWATELDWSAGCFDSAGREQIDTIQKTLVAVIERIEGMLNPEGNMDGN